MRDAGLKRALTAAPWAAVDALTTALYGVFFLFIVGLFVGPTDLGLASSALAFMLLVEAFTSAGIQDAVIRLPSSNTHQTDTAYCLATGLACIGMPIVWVAAYIYGWASDEPRLFPLAVFASLMLPLNAAAVVPTAMLIRKMRGPQLLLRPVAGKVLGIVAMVALALAGARVYAVVAGSVFTSLGGVLALRVTATRWPQLRWDRGNAVSHLRFGLFSGADNLFFLISLRVLTLAFGNVFGMRALGFLQLAMRLVEEASRLLQSIMMRYALAMFASYSRSTQGGGRTETGRGLLLGTRLMNALGVPTFIGVALVGDLFVHVTFGAQWDEAIFYVRAFAIATLLAFARLLVSPALKAIGRPKMVAIASTVNFASALVVIATVAFVDAHTLIGLWASREVLQLVIWFRMAHRELGMRYRDLAIALVPSWTSGALMASALLVVRFMLPAHHEALDLAILVMTGMLVYSAALFGWEHALVIAFLRERRAQPTVAGGRN